MADDRIGDDPVLDVSRRFVRVRGLRRGLVEFEFAIGDPSIFIEMLLQPEDFQAFCQAHTACVLDADSDNVPTQRL
jgi:phenol hydroxylase P0 protein